jgi:hypothetical protein
MGYGKHYEGVIVMLSAGVLDELGAGVGWHSETTQVGVVLPNRSRNAINMSLVV